MLHFIMGNVSSGKTTYLHHIIGEALEKNERNAVLIVPEQFTFETDRGILDTLGPVKSNRVEVYSFTRLAEAVFEEYAVENKPVITEQGRLIFMSRALKEVRDRLEIYREHTEDKAFIRNMILAVNEFKQSANEKAHTESVIRALPQGVLKKKMEELCLICEAYDALVKQSNTDTGDVLTRLYEVLLEKDYFSGKTVAIDGFSSFNAQVLKIIGRIMSQCDELYVTLTTDSLHYEENQNDVFAFTRRTASRLRALAGKNSVSVAKPVIISEETTAFSPYSSKYLKKLEKDFYRSDFEVCGEKTDDITVYCASDIDDECAFTARKIRQLNRAGVRCRDIAVIYRDEERYERKIKAAFRKYEIPVFEDKREPVENQPLILFVRAALEICKSGFSTENIMRLLKTGISPLTVEEISEIENYVYMWQIDGKRWRSVWKGNPAGFTERKTDESLLFHLNELREKIVLPLEKLRDDMKGKNGKEISALIYNFLRETETDKRLLNLAGELEADGEITLALEQEQIWNILMSTLNECAAALPEEQIGISSYYDMLELSLSAATLGKIPNGIDEVTVGAASRIKTRNTDTVFVLGLNAGVFPAVPGDGGLLSNNDKTILSERGLELFDLNKYKSVEERFIAYNALCRARKQLFLSYALRGAPGDEKLKKSEIISFVERLFPNALSLNSDMISEEEKIEGEEATFELLASHFRENGYYSKNLLAYFSALPAYEKKTESLKRVSQELDFKFDSPENAKKLFGMKMYLSASRVEDYETCPFKYFCRYGMGAEPRKRAVLDPSQSGTVIHHVLENIIREYSEKGIQNVSEEERSAAVRRILSEYAENSMGGLDDKDMRFNYHFNRFARVLDTLLDRIVNEFSSSMFVPCEFELEIGDGGKVPSYSIKLSDGGEVRIHGYIDRVDKFELDEKTYIRVVDYKTGRKEMVLSDVLSGMNMQMLIYLFALLKNGNACFGEKLSPAGVLYFPARITAFSAQRDESEASLNERIMKSGKMNGVVLNDGRIVSAMDKTGKCIFIPVKINAKDGKMSGNLVSEKQFALLNEKIDKIISDMALSLHSGKIEANPVSGKNHENTCDYCDYKSVCGHEKSGSFRHIEPEKFEDTLKKLEGGEE